MGWVSAANRVNRRHLMMWTALVILLHLALRLYATQTLEVDDAEQVDHAYSGFLLGYQADQPPLFTWIVVSLFSLTGPSFTTYFLFKYSLISLTFAYFFRLAKRLFVSEPLQEYASVIPWGIWLFCYPIFVGFSHTILLGVAVLMTFDALLLLPQGRRRHFLYFGISIAVGSLSKYSYVLFLLPLLLSALTIKEYRRCLLRWETLFALIGAAFLIAPHGVWLWNQLDWATTTMQKKLRIEGTDSSHDILHVYYKFLRASLAFLCPLIIGYVAAFPKLSLRSLSVEGRLLARFYALVLLLVVGGAMFVHIGPVRPRWLFPLLLLLPFSYLMMKKTRHLYSRAIILAVTFGSSLVGVGYHLETYVLAPYLGHGGRPNWPIMQTLSELPVGEQIHQHVYVRSPFLISHVILFANPKGCSNRLEEIDTSKPYLVLWTEGGEPTEEWLHEHQCAPVQMRSPERAGMRYPIYFTTAQR